MTLDQVLDLARSLAGDVDPLAYRYPRDRLLRVLEQQLVLLVVRQVAALEQLTLDLTANAETITPAPTNEQGAILAHAVAVAILQETYRGRVDRGEIGVVWRSGLEEESTVSQERAYQLQIQELAGDLEELKLISRRTTFATRPQ